MRGPGLGAGLGVASVEPGGEALGGFRLREGPLRLLRCRWRGCGNVGFWREQRPVSGHVDNTW